MLPTRRAQLMLLTPIAVMGLGLAVLVWSDFGSDPPGDVEPPRSKPLVVIPHDLGDETFSETALERIPLSAERPGVSFVPNAGKASYDIAPSGTHYKAINSAHGLRVRFTPKGIQLFVLGDKGPDESKWELGLSRCGHGDALIPVLPAMPTASGNRVEYRRVTASGFEFTEWYNNSPRGVVQGFALRTAPGSTTGGEPLVLELSVSGESTPDPEQDGKSIGLAARGGAYVLRYGDLWTLDAHGHHLPSRLEMRAGRIVVAVDDSAGSYPLSIYRLLTVETSGPRAHAGTSPADWSRSPPASDQGPVRM